LRRLKEFKQDFPVHGEIHSLRNKAYAKMTFAPDAFFKLSFAALLEVFEELCTSTCAFRWKAGRDGKAETAAYRPEIRAYKERFPG